jgi:mono/diheme cytochrome c family protein
MRPFIIAIMISNWGGASGLAESTATGKTHLQVQKLFARHCLECHGPDAEQRQAALRLDDKTNATTAQDSGRTAIVPGSPQKSELLRRIVAKDETRMPPREAGAGLSTAEIQLVTRWINDGAKWTTHWAFLPPEDHELPPVRDSKWSRQPLDRFILNPIEAAGVVPTTSDRRTLIRRIYIDLIGLPPTPQQVQDFQNSQSPDAWTKVIDELLESPLYGQRWGRHWLDVVRYADSNGSDENHAYPLAWRYRNYVIDAFDADIPFDQFVQEQLAGDLLDSDARRNEGITATAFLAIGTKILAEKDPAKKQADMVDEQIDTIGKALLGFTLACARCHDHKFDPIPADDYYALAGILHSTRMEDRALETDTFLTAKMRHDQQVTELQATLQKLEQKLTENGNEILFRQAEKFQRGNAARLKTGYGEGIGIISDPGAQKTWVEWDVAIKVPSKYLFQFRYAALSARPGILSINGRTVNETAVNQTTGGWMPQHQKWISEGTFAFLTGNNTIRFESEPVMSHIDSIRLIRVGGADWEHVLADIDHTKTQLNALAENAPEPARVMAVAEGEPHDVKLHMRGNHLSLGEIVQRGFPLLASGVDSETTDLNHPIDAADSGRLQLAHWITDSQNGAGRQLARVIVNRVWQWHFGRAIVPSANNFGLQGELPTHPELLDWLALRLIEDNWSLKALHRRILNSATYRQRTATEPNSLFAGYARRRMDAEVIRDTLLFHAGRLDVTSAEYLGGVKSQDPSPEDLRNNEDLHRNSDKRSVYLPVIRSNTYRFFTAFDFPNSTTSIGRREMTTVPTQALLMMNDPFLMDQAQRFAASVLDAKSELTELTVINEIYSRLFNRVPSTTEKEFAWDFVTTFSEAIDANTSEQEAWAALCHTLMLSGEFVYVE